MKSLRNLFLFILPFAMLWGEFYVGHVLGIGDLDRWYFFPFLFTSLALLFLSLGVSLAASGLLDDEESDEASE